MIEWITTTGTTLLMVLLSAIGIYVALLVLTRTAGLRSFSKMSSFDFAITVAFGSIIASTLLAEDPTLLVGAFGLATLYGIQFTVSKIRRSSSIGKRLVDNVPLVVMAGAEVLHDHLDEARMTVDDLRSKLRAASVTHPKQVFAVVFETTGDVSVIKKSDEIDLWLFEEIRGAEKLESSTPS